MASDSEAFDERIAQFWDRYLVVLDQHRVKPTAARWYVVRVEDYLEARKDHKLRDQGPEDVVSYLKALGENQRLESWQLGQAVHALELLLCSLLAVPWCRDVDWEYWKAAFGERSGDRIFNYAMHDSKPNYQESRVYHRN